MWKDLGLNLEKHDVLLNALAKGYGDLFMTQKNRPAGLGYFDFVISEVHGLRIKELVDRKKAGKKIIGAFCLYVPEELVYAADAADPPRLMILSGNTLGVFDPLAEIRYISQCMKSGDRLIVDGEIYAANETLARRSSPGSRNLLWALLGAIGINQDDGELRFNDKRDDRHAGLHLTTKYFRAERDLSATAAGQEVSLARGERIGLNFQYAYEPETFRWLLCEHGGLEIESEYRSPDGRFLTAICTR